MEQTLHFVMNNEIFTKLYPNTSYEFVEMGKLESLRNSTSINKVHRFHEHFYRPENIVLTITGRVDIDRLLQVFKASDENIYIKKAVKSPEPFQRPWLKELERLYMDNDEVTEVEYPSDDETKG